MLKKSLSNTPGKLETTETPTHTKFTPKILSEQKGDLKKMNKKRKSLPASLTNGGNNTSKKPKVDPFTGTSGLFVQMKDSESESTITEKNKTKSPTKSKATIDIQEAASKKNKKKERKERIKLLRSAAKDRFRKTIANAISGDKEAINHVKDQIAELEKKEKLSKSGKRKLNILKRTLKRDASSSNKKGKGAMQTPKASTQKIKQKKEEKKTNIQTKATSDDEDSDNDSEQEKTDMSEIQAKIAEDDTDENDSEEDDAEEKKIYVKGNKKSPSNQISLETEGDSENESEEAEEDESSEDDNSNLIGEESIEGEGEEDEDDDDEQESDSEEKSDTEIKNTNKEKISKKEVQKKSFEKKTDSMTISHAGGQSQYTVFVGNLPFDVTKEDISEHFSKIGNIKDVRIPLDKQTNKCRGFAYVELLNQTSYQKALSLDQTSLKGRKINVSNSEDRRGSKGNKFSPKSTNRGANQFGNFKKSPRQGFNKQQKRNSYNKN